MAFDKLYFILTRNFIPFEKLPIKTLMIEAILDHDYGVANSDTSRAGPKSIGAGRTG